MTQSQILLSLLLKAAGLPCSVEQFDDRLTLQKAVYLLQQAGVQLGYPFSWYVRGPYSARLAEDLFYLADLASDEKEELGHYVLGDRTSHVAQQVKEILDPTGTGWSKALYSELLASVLFLTVTKQAGADDHQKLTQILQANQKPFGSEDVEKAVRALKNHGYV